MFRHRLALLPPTRDFLPSRSMSIASEIKRSSDDIQIAVLPSQEARECDPVNHEVNGDPVVQYSSYKRRFVGLTSLVRMNYTVTRKQH